MSSSQSPPDQPIAGARDVKILFPVLGGRAMAKAVDGVSFDVREGETFGIIGESGSGKTTLGRALVCLLRPTSGSILHQGVDPQSLSARNLRRHRRDYQIIFQDPNAALDPRMSIQQSVREPLDIADERPSEERDRIVSDVLERVGLSADFASRYPHELSGGQKARVNIARALALRPKLIVCDEVVAPLDVSIQADILNLFADLQREFKLTYVFITHDLGVVAHVSDRIAVMYLGVFVELGPAEAVKERSLHPYTEALLSAEPSPLPSALRTENRIILEGEIPSPISPPSGCRFRTRCRFATERCAAEVPQWRQIETNHWVACHYAGEVTGELKRKPTAEAMQALEPTMRQR